MKSFFFIFILLTCFCSHVQGNNEIFEEVWINNTQVDSTRRIKMTSNMIYKVGEMARGSGILFYAYATDKQWIVRLLLEKLTNTNQIVIDGSSYETNGTIEANIPPATGHLPYNMENRINSDSQTTFEISTLTLKLTFVKNWKFSIENPTIGLIRAVPQGTNAVFDFLTSGSTVSLLGFSKFMTIVNAEITVEPSLLNQSVSLHTAGSLSSVSINLESFSRYDFNDGCLKVNPFTRVPEDPDDWYLTQMRFYGIPIDKAFKSCSLYTHKINELKLKVPKFSASDLTQVNNLKSLNIESGDLELTESKGLKDSKMTYNSLYVNNDYQVRITPGFSVQVNSKFDVKSNLTVECQKYEKLSNWNFNCKSDTPLYWNTSSCFVRLCPIDNNQVPSIKFSSNSDIIDLSMNLVTLLPSTNNSREIYMNDKSLKVFDNEPNTIKDYFDIKWGNIITFKYLFSDLKNWRLKVTTPNIQSQIINLYSSESLNGIVEIENLKNEKTQIDINQDSLKIGDLFFKTCQAKQIKISNIVETSFNIDSTPNQAELILNNPVKSNGVIQELTNVAMILNSQVLITKDLSMISGMLILSGKESIALVNSYNKEFSMKSNCILESSNIKRASNWFINIVENNGIPFTPDYLKCTMNIINLDMLEVAALNSNFKDVDNKFTKKLIIADGDLNYNFLKECSSLKVNTRSINIENKVEIQFSSGKNVNLELQFCDSNSIVFDSKSNQNINYNVNCRNGSLPLMKTSSSFYNAIFCNIQESKFSPLIQLLTYSNYTSIQMDLSENSLTSLERDIDIIFQKITIKGITNIIWFEPTTKLLMKLQNGRNFVKVDQQVSTSGSLPLLSISTSAQVTLDLPQSSSIVFQDSQVEFNPRSFLIETKKNDFNSCLIPKYQCLPQTWIDSQIFQTTCLHKKYQDECKDNTLLYLSFIDGSFSCNVGNTTSLQFSSNITMDSSKKTSIYGFNFSVLYYFYYFFMAIGSILYPYFYIFDFGYSSLIVAGLLENVHQKDFSFIRRSIIDFSNAITFGSSDWICRDSITVYKIAPFFITLFSILIGLLLGFLIFYKKITSRFFKPHSLLNSDESALKTFGVEFSYYSLLNISTFTLPIMTYLWKNTFTLVLNSIYIIIIISLFIICVISFILNRESFKLSLIILFQPIILIQIALTFIVSLLSLFHFQTVGVPIFIFIVYQIIRGITLLILTISLYKYFKSDLNTSKIYTAFLSIFLALSYILFISSFVFGLLFINLPKNHLEMFLTWYISSFLCGVCQTFIISPVLNTKSDEEYQQIGNVNIKDEKTEEVDEQYKFYNY